MSVNVRPNVLQDILEALVRLGDLYERRLREDGYLQPTRTLTQSTRDDVMVVNESKAFEELEKVKAERRKKEQLEGAVAPEEGSLV